jgi:hypothetical protein
MNLTSRPIVRLPANDFPARADEYFCPSCGRDVTKQVRARQSHSWTPLGPMRFTCPCGQKYLTGAIEWDHLGRYQRLRRVRMVLLESVCLSILSSIPASLFYVALRFVFDLRRVGSTVAWLIIFLPFVLVQLTFWFGVLASIRRTRFGRQRFSAHCRGPAI